jgi:tRNA A-37 threonylcarbamoyl transferase component Bud32
VLKQRFVLDQKLGSGGMGTVYRAKDLRKVEARDRHPYVAVKVLNDDFRTHPEAFIALQREAVKSQVLSHPSIVSIYDFDKDGDVPFIIMELLEGQELAELLRAYPTGLPDEAAWSIIRCVCDGLEHAHAAGLVHADFKPGNVFVSPSHSAKILDFGIARAVQVNQAHGDDSVFDPTRLAALTPAYASPEMLDGREPEVRDDLFSLGVVLYLMLTGQHPYGRVPADEAARHGLVPERPRRLSRRQWRVLQRCLAFDRAERPASVSEVKKHLFQPSPWRSRTAVVGALAVVVTFAVSGFKEEAAVQEAKVEARQSTLVDAQLSRLAALAAAERVDAAWRAEVAEELELLRSLLPAAAVEPPVLERLRARYREAILAAEDPVEAVALYRQGLALGALPEAARALDRRLTATVDALLDAPALSEAWMDALDRALGLVESAFPSSPRLATLRLETTAVLEAELDARIAAEEFPAARRALAFLETYSFDADALERLQARIEDAERAYLARQAERERQATWAAFAAELDAALAGTCLDFDPAPAADVFGHWLGQHPGLEQAARGRVGEHVSRCVAQLAALDRERAVALQQRAGRLFGPLPGVAAVREDPCAAGYLVGSGGQGGRRGFCADRLSDGAPGPRLVVVPGAAGTPSFAITRGEVSWAELAPFCRATGECPAAGPAELPVAGVPVALARAYADWLSRQTGFSYRLPTYREWRRAAGGAPDPDRNCRVQLGGVHRGLAPVAADTGTPNEYGLVNALGNVQEWVTEGGGVRVAGGAYRDPIAECTVATLRPHGGEPDPATGFRLLREVS